MSGKCASMEGTYTLWFDESSNTEHKSEVMHVNTDDSIF